MVGGQRHASAALPPGKTRYPLYRRLGGPQSQSGRVRKISPPSGLDPRAVQPVASRYTDWGTPDLKNKLIVIKTALFVKYIRKLHAILNKLTVKKWEMWRYQGRDYT